MPNPACRGDISHVERQQMKTAKANMEVTANANPMYPPGWSSPTAESTMSPSNGINVPDAVERNSRTVDSVVRSLKSAVISPGNVLYDVPNSCASMTHTTYTRQYRNVGSPGIHSRQPTSTAGATKASTRRRRPNRLPMWNRQRLSHSTPKPSAAKALRMALMPITLCVRPMSMPQKRFQNNAR